MGPKAEAVVSKPSGDFASSPAPRPQGPVFADAAPLPITNVTGFVWDGATASITAADIDNDGATDLFVAGAPTNAVLLRRGESFALSRDHPLANIPGVHSALWGDYDNDGMTDVYLCRRGANQLWRHVKPNEWQDVTESTKSSGGDADTVAGAFFDADHDGDLDLFLVNADRANELLNNNGNGTFRPLGKETGLADDGRRSVGVVANDFDNDGDSDILVLKGPAPQEWWLNDRFWKYRRGGDAEPFGIMTREPFDVASAVDNDADGRVELYASHMLDVDGSGVLRPFQAPPEFTAWAPVVLD